MGDGVWNAGDGVGHIWCGTFRGRAPGVGYQGSGQVGIGQGRSFFKKHICFLYVFVMKRP